MPVIAGPPSRRVAILSAEVRGCQNIFRTRRWLRLSGKVSLPVSILYTVFRKKVIHFVLNITSQLQARFFFTIFSDRY